MTEQEIIDYLKGNKTKGVAYLFLSEDVWEWIGENFRDPKLMYLAPNGKWELFSETDFDDFDNVVFALPEYYKVKQESKGEWVEFEIDKNGQFFIEFCEGSLAYCYDWFYWWKLLEKSKEYDYGFTAFGGWQYPNNSCWSMYPQVKIGRGSTNYTSYYLEKEQGEDYEIGPAIPTKIRFWRKA